MKEVTKIKTWEIIVAIALLTLIPIAINFLIQLPRITNVVGDERDWLAFHGSYLGAVIAAGISFFVMYKTLQYHKKEDEYRHKIERLNDIRKFCADFVSAFNINNVIVVINEMAIDAQMAYKHCEQYINQLMKEDVTLSLYVIETEDEDLHMMYKDLRRYQELYRKMLLNVQQVVVCVLNNNNKNEQKLGVSKQDLMNSVDSDNLKEQLDKASNSKDRIDIQKLHNELLDWIGDFSNIYKEMTDSCILYIGKKQRELIV